MILKLTELIGRTITEANAWEDKTSLSLVLDNGGILQICALDRKPEPILHWQVEFATETTPPADDVVHKAELDEALGRIDAIEHAILALRSAYNLKEDARIEAQLAAANEHRIKETLKPNWDVKEGAYAAEEAAWPHWGDSPNGFDGPGGAE